MQLNSELSSLSRCTCTFSSGVVLVCVFRVYGGFFCTSSPLSVVVFCWCCCWLWSNFSFHTVTALSWAVVLGSVQFSCNVVKCGEELHSPLNTELLHGLSVCRPDRSAAGLVRLLKWHFSNSIEIIWHSDTLTQLKSYQTNKYLFHFVKNDSNNNNSN